MIPPDAPLLAATRSRHPGSRPQRAKGRPRSPPPGAPCGFTPGLTPIGSPELPSPKRKGCLLEHCPLPSTLHPELSFILGEGLLGRPNHHHPSRPLPVTPWIAYLPLATGISPTPNSPALPEARLEGRHPPALLGSVPRRRIRLRSPLSSTLKHPLPQGWVEVPASRDLGEGALLLAPALRWRSQVARGLFTLCLVFKESQRTLGLQNSPNSSSTYRIGYFSMLPCPPPQPYPRFLLHLTNFKFPRGHGQKV